MGDGQFDRFSAARRTRRFKRNSETPEIITTSPELIAETQVLKPNALQVEVSVPVQSPEINTDKESRLKAWQDKLKMQTDLPETKNSVPRRTRHQTGINRDDVKKALQMTTSAPINIVNSKNVSTTYINSTDGKKTKEHDNDEGKYILLITLYYSSS